MEIAIIGAGHIGGNIARRLAGRSAHGNTGTAVIRRLRLGADSCFGCADGGSGRLAGWLVERQRGRLLGQARATAPTRKR